MGRVNASMKDVSTDFNPVEPGVHEYEVESFEEKKDDDTGRVMYEVKQKVVRVVQGGRQEDAGRNVTTRIHIHKRDGELNEMGLAQLKRYFEVILGEERANAEDADTDELLKGHFLGETTIRTYKTKDKLTGEDRVGKSNEISRMAPVV